MHSLPSVSYFAIATTISANDAFPGATVTLFAHRCLFSLLF